MKTIILATLLHFLFLASHASNTGPHGGEVVEDSTHRFEVRFDPNGTNVEVFMLNGSKRKLPPKQMAITLFRDGETDQTIELKAVAPKNSTAPRYQGELALGAGSYVGAELKFEVSLKSFKALKFVPRIPSVRGNR